MFLKKLKDFSEEALDEYKDNKYDLTEMELGFEFFWMMCVSMLQE